MIRTGKQLQANLKSGYHVTSGEKVAPYKWSQRIVDDNGNIVINDCKYTKELVQKAVEMGLVK